MIIHPTNQKSTKLQYTKFINTHFKNCSLFQGQGHEVKIHDLIWKLLSQGIYLPGFNCLSQSNNRLWPKLQFFCPSFLFQGQGHEVKVRNFDFRSYKSYGKSSWMKSILWIMFLYTISVFIAHFCKFCENYAFCDDHANVPIWEHSTSNPYYDPNYCCNCKISFFSVYLRHLPIQPCQKNFELIWGKLSILQLINFGWKHDFWPFLEIHILFRTLSKNFLLFLGCCPIPHDHFGANTFKLSLCITEIYILLGHVPIWEHWHEKG